MRLGELISDLSNFHDASPIRFDFGSEVGVLRSWRGAYDKLSLDHGTDPVTVKDVLADAKAAVGKTFTGYKGGDYRMDEQTAVYADPDGEYSGRIITGISERVAIYGRVVTIQTLILGDEYQW